MSTFNLQALLARINSVRIAPPAALVIPAGRMQAKTGTKNLRSVMSVIEESEEPECFEYEQGEYLTIEQ